MLSRRNFLRSGTLSALSVGLAVGAGHAVFGQNARQNPALDFLIPDSAPRDALFYYSRAAFENAVGSTFTSPDSRGRMVNLTLDKVTPYKSNLKTKLTNNGARPTDSFALVFNAPRNLSPVSSIYKMNHPVLGKFDLFMTLRKTDGGTMFYDAVINHLL